MIHFFRSSAWSLENIRERWFSIVKESFPIYKEGKFCVLKIHQGVDKKLWYNALFFLLIVILYYISTGGIHMDDIKSPSAVTIGELSRIVKEFEEKIQNGTEDPDRFLTLTEIEELWGKLIGDTNVLYSDMLQSLIQNIDERELVRQKKENSRFNIKDPLPAVFKDRFSGIKLFKSCFCLSAVGRTKKGNGNTASRKGTM